MNIRRLTLAVFAPLALFGQIASPFAVYEDRANRALDRFLANLSGAQTMERASPVDHGIALANPFDPPVDPVDLFANRFWNGRTDDLRAALLRLSSIRPALEQILAEEGVPSHFVAVVLVESGVNPMALSSKSARGLWQIMPETAHRYGLSVTTQRDDRTDALKSTRAAAQYLRDLYHVFGEWRLALAAYNAGEGAVQRAIQRTRSLDFRVLVNEKVLPTETGNYVPAVFAAVKLLNRQ